MSGPWWLIFPIMGLAFGLMNKWMRHRRSESTIELIKAYLAQGKEPPPELLVALQLSATQDSAVTRSSRAAVMFGAVSAGMLLAFAIGKLSNAANVVGLLITGVILGAVAVGYAVAARLSAK